MIQTRDDPWLPFGTGDTGPVLVCLPFAGGGASSFLGWRRALPGLSVAPVQYPGHETRLDEACVTQVDALLDSLSHCLVRRLAGRRYGLLGFSLGARLAFSLVHRLQALGLPPPGGLHVVAHRSLDLPPRVTGAWRLDDAGFREHIRAYGGTPDEVFDTPELAQMLLPVLRADLALAEQPIAIEPVNAPIRAYCGIDDPAAGPDDMQGWQRLTQGDFSLKVFRGGHFFPRHDTGFLPALSADAALWAQAEDRARR